MRVYYGLCQTLSSTPDGHVFDELASSHICDPNPGSASAYIHACDYSAVSYHLVYEGEGVSLDTTPLLIAMTQFASTALTFR